MKQLLLLGILVWMGITFGTDFSRYNQEINLLFSKDDAVGKIGTIIKRSNEIIKNINDSKLPTNYKKELAKLLLQQINADPTINDPKNFNQPNKKELDLIKKDLNTLISGKKIIYFSSKNFDNLDNEVNVDDLRQWTTEINGAESIADLSNVLLKLSKLNTTAYDDFEVLRTINHAGVHYYKPIKGENNSTQYRDNLQKMVIQAIAEKLDSLNISVVDITRMAKVIKIEELNKKLPEDSFEIFKKAVEAASQPKNNKQKYRERFNSLKKALLEIQKLDSLQKLKNFDIDALTTIDKKTVKSKNDKGDNNKNDWVDNQNATIKNIVDGLTAKYTAPENTGTKLQLKTTIESYVKKYLVENKSSWQNNQNTDLFVNQLKNVRSIIMEAIDNYANQNPNTVNKMQLKNFTTNIFSEAIRDYVKTINQVFHSNDLEALLKNNVLETLLNNDNHSEQEIKPSRELFGNSDSSDQNSSQAHSISDPKNPEIKPKNLTRRVTDSVKKIIKNSSYYLNKLFNNISSWIKIDYQSHSLKNIQDRLEETSEDNRDANFFRNLFDQIMKSNFPQKDREAALDLLNNALQEKMGNTSEDTEKIELNRTLQSIQTQQQRLTDNQNNLRTLHSQNRDSTDTLNSDDDNKWGSSYSSQSTRSDDTDPDNYDPDNYDRDNYGD